jgi:hypothetical protein
MTEPNNPRFAHWANITFKLILLALVVVWIIFPPKQASKFGLNQTRIEAVSDNRG